jgi:uncharacterized membrane protein
MVEGNGDSAVPATAEANERDATWLNAFSDGVFAIAITLLVLGIRRPAAQHLGRGLLNLWPSYLAYVVSFLLIGQVWANHHAVFDHIRKVDRMLMFLNTVLLLDVAFLPFVASVLADSLHAGQGEGLAVVFYGSAFGSGTVFFNLMWQYARRGLLKATIDPAVARRVGRRFMAGPVLYMIGAGFGALFPPAGIALFAALVPLYWFPIRGER